MNIFDHSKAVSDILKAGVDCYMSKGTSEKLQVADHHRTVIAAAMESWHIGQWIVVPFPLEHDAVDPFGFYILRREDRLLFIPDSAYVKNRFDGVTILAIECNFIGDILTDNILSGSLPPVVGHRVRRNHMSLETVVKMLKANDLSKCRQIWLLHLSDGNSDEKQMIREVQEATGIPCRAA